MDAKIEQELKTTIESLKGFEPMFKELSDLQKNGQLTTIKGLPEQHKTLGDTVAKLEGELSKLKKSDLKKLSLGEGHIRVVGGVPHVTDDAAAALAAHFCLQADDIGALKNLVRDESRRKQLLTQSATRLGFESVVEAKTALDSTTTPLPTIYMPQIVELIWFYGQARKCATVYPLGAGIVKLPRLKAGEDDFAFLGAGTGGNSQSVAEKRVSAELVTFTANKAGGLIRIPTEIEEDTFIPLGQFLARYIARQFAKLEDKTLFLGDGTATYANITGVGPYCVANSTYLVQLSAGKTKPSDATLADFRNLRAKVNAAVLVSKPAYYMHPTMEALLRTFNTVGAPQVYVQGSANTPATLDGYPIIWVGVMQPYSTAAAASTFLSVFGDLTYWYLGERGTPRVEVSREVFFATDELAMRALARIDVEALAIDAMTALETAAA